MSQLSSEIKPSKSKCCVPNCLDRYSSRFRFPLPRNSEMVKKWLTKINNPVLNTISYEDLYDKYRVCARHFPNEAIMHGFRRGIIPDAVPILHLGSGSPDTDVSFEEIINLEDPKIPDRNQSHQFHIKDYENLPSTSQTESELQPSPKFEVLDVNLPSTSRSYLQERNVDADRDADSHINVTPEVTPKTSNIYRKITKSGRRNILKEVNVTRQNSLTPKAKHLYKKVIDSCNTIGRLHKKVSSYKSRLAAAGQLVSSEKFENLMKYVNPMTYNFILSQVRTQTQKPKARRFTLDEKLLALTILKASGKGYRLIAKIFTLPSKQTLVSLLNKIPFKAGVNQQIFKTLERTVKKMKPIDRHAILVFDEMSIESVIHYDSREDEINGLHDLGSNQRKPEMADHVNVCMLKGIFRQWKQPVCYTFTGGPMKSGSLKSVIKSIIQESHNIGIKIWATVCDQGGPNQAAIKKLLEETKEDCLRKNEENQYFGFLVDNIEIVPLYDTPHLFKGIRNNLLTKNLHFTIGGKNCIAKWDHLEQFYYLDTKDEVLRVCPKLTDYHIVRGKINKMKVSCCTQVFSYQVGVLMKKIISWKSEVELDKESVDTAELILFLDKLFDSLNSSKRFSIPGKPMKAAVTLKSDHISYWYDCIKILQTMKFFCPKKNKFVNIPSLSNLIHTIKGFMYLANKFFNLFPSKYILTRVFQQDALENFFSCIRGYSGRETALSVSHFRSSFKALIVNNFMSTHAPGANCEEDENDGILSDFKYLLTGETQPDVTYLELEPEEITLPSEIVVYGRAKIAKCTLAYFSGFILKKMLKKIQCSTCKSNLAVRHTNEDLDFIEAREYDKCKLQTAGTFLNFLVTQSISRLFYIIPRICHLKNISTILYEIISKQLHFSLLNCSNHPENHQILIKLIIKCSLYFWCRRVNLVACGKDDKFIKYLRMKPNKNLIDPIKLAAYKKYQSKISRSKAYQKKNYENFN